MRAGATALVLAAALAGAGPAGAQGVVPMVRVPAGEYFAFFKFSAGAGKTALRDGPTKIRAFRLDVTPVTNALFADFVRDHPQWRRSNAKSLFVDSGYLADWPSDLAPAPGAGEAPATHVSWFAAQAFCEARGLRLPTTDEWEYALHDEGRDHAKVAQVSLDWFASPNPKRLPAVGQGAPNGFAARDMVGLVWEWTQDFASAGPGSEQRGAASQDGAQFCSGAALGVRDAADYPAFMRYALRAALKASFTQANLGFRCAGDP